MVVGFIGFVRRRHLLHWGYIKKESKELYVVTRCRMMNVLRRQWITGLMPARGRCWKIPRKFAGSQMWLFRQFHLIMQLLLLSMHLME